MSHWVKFFSSLWLYFTILESIYLCMNKSKIVHLCPNFTIWNIFFFLCVSVLIPDTSECWASVHLITATEKCAFPQGLENPCKWRAHMWVSSELEGVPAVSWCEGVEGVARDIGQLMLQSSCKWIIALVLNRCVDPGPSVLCIVYLELEEGDFLLDRIFSSDARHVPFLNTFLQTMMIKICQNTENTRIGINTPEVLCLSLLSSVEKDVQKNVCFLSFEGNL